MTDGGEKRTTGGGADMFGGFKFRVMPIQHTRKIRQRKGDVRDREEAFYRLLVAEKKQKKLRGGA